MEFRWVAAITLWTVLAGPILAPPAPSSSLRDPVLDAAPVRPVVNTDAAASQLNERLPSSQR